MVTADLIRQIHRTNGIVAFCYGLLVNSILIFLVLRSRLHAYKRVLLQMSFVDCTFLVFAAFVDPIVVFIDGTEVVLNNSAFRYVPQPYNLIMLSVWVYGLYFSVFSIGVQFFYRYLVLCRSKIVSNQLLICMIIVPMVLAGLMAFLLQIGFQYEPEEERFFTYMLKELLLESGETSIHPSGIARKGNVPLLILISCAFVLMVGTYSLIVFCVIQINRTLTMLAPHLKPSTRSLHHQLSIVLIVQAVLPLAVSVVPLLFVFWCIVTHGTAFMSQIVLTMCFSWIPSGNATTALIYVRQFRRKLLRLLGFTRDAPSSFSERTSQFFRRNLIRVQPRTLSSHDATLDLEDSDTEGV